MSGFLGVPVDAAYHLVSALAAVLAPLAGGLAAAAAIVVFTLAVRLLVLPLSVRAARGLAAQARLAPKVRALRDKHAGQPDRLRRELAALHEAEGTSALAGCLPLLLQWPFFTVMYLLFRSPVIVTCWARRSAATGSAAAARCPPRERCSPACSCCSPSPGGCRPG